LQLNITDAGFRIQKQHCRLVIHFKLVGRYFYMPVLLLQTRYLQKNRSATHCYHDIDDRDLAGVSFSSFLEINIVLRMVERQTVVWQNTNLILVMWLCVKATLLSCQFLSARCLPFSAENSSLLQALSSIVSLSSFSRTELTDHRPARVW